MRVLGHVFGKDRAQSINATTNPFDPTLRGPHRPISPQSPPTTDDSYNTMDALLKKAETVGIPEKDAKSTIGGVLSFVKSKVSEEQYQMICEKVPGASDLVKETESSRAEGTQTSGGGGGGLMGMASSLMSKMQQDGGSVGSIPELMVFLKGAGVDEKQIAKYLPEITKVLKEKTGIDVSSMLGVSAPPETQAAA